MSDDCFGELRSLLQEPPSPGRWDRITRQLEAWPDIDDLATRVVPYVQAHLRDDPHPRPAPRRWLSELEQEPDAEHPALTLVDAITWAAEEEVDGDALVDELCGRGILGRLERLEFAFVECSAHTLAALGRELGPALEVLKLWQCSKAREYDGGLGELLSAGGWTSLRVLDLGSNLMPASVWEHLGDVPSLDTLRLACAPLSGEVFDALARCDWVTRLRALDVRHTTLMGDSTKRLLSALTPSLEHLAIGGCLLYDDDLASLCDADFAPTLRHLDLGRAYHLDESRSSVKVMPLGSSHAGPMSSVGAFLERSRRMTSLRHLEVFDCFLDGGDVDAFSRAEHLRSVERLDISLNALTDDGVEAMLQTPLCDGLLTLDVSFNATTTALADVLVNAPSLRALRALSLRGAELGPIGVRWLSQAPFMSQLESLDLFRNGVDSRVTLQTVLRSLDTSLIRSLDLSDNPLDDRAVDALVDADLTALARLILDRDAFSERARRLLKGRYPFVHFID